MKIFPYLQPKLKELDFSEDVELLQGLSGHDIPIEEEIDPFGVPLKPQY